MPLEAAVGAAWVSDVGEVELNVKAQTGHSVYPLLQHQVGRPDHRPGRRQSGPADPVPLSRHPFRVPLDRQRGLRWLPESAQGRALEAPRRICEHPSPVGSADGFFDRINLNSVTLGVGGASKHISGSLGFNYQLGSSEQGLVADLAGSELTRTKVKISNIGIIYSASYVF